MAWMMGERAPSARLQMTQNCKKSPTHQMGLQPFGGPQQVGETGQQESLEVQQRETQRATPAGPRGYKILDTCTQYNGTRCSIAITSF